jgi:glycerol-3-phosphate acyltransferase PlsY
MFWLLSGAALVIGYALGSVPTAYLAVRRATRGFTDIRFAGDGNAGAHNVSRICGRSWGISVGVADIAKGVVTVLAFNALAYLFKPPDVESAGTGFLGGVAALSGPGMLAGVATIAGQIWPAWLQFRGGRGAATAAGVTSAVLPGPILLVLLPAMVILVTTRSTTLTLTFIYLSSVVVAKAFFDVDWGPIWYCLAIFVGVGTVHFWTVKYRSATVESTSTA